MSRIDINDERTGNQDLVSDKFIIIFLYGFIQSKDKFSFDVLSTF